MNINELINHYEQSLSVGKSDTHDSVSAEYDALISAIMQESACASLPHGDEIAARLWSMAYDRGHSDSVLAVYTEFRELDELISDVIAIYDGKDK